VEDFKYMGSTLTNQILSRKKLRAEWRQGMLIIRRRIFCHTVCYPKIWRFKIYKIIILRVVLYGCETWSLTLREKRRLRVFRKMALRIIFGPKRGEVTREGRKLHNEELNDLYHSPSIFRVVKLRIMRWKGRIVLWGRKELQAGF